MTTTPAFTLNNSLGKTQIHQTYQINYYLGIETLDPSDHAMIFHRLNWNSGSNKFMCPCHGSQYDAAGKVVRGPAPLSLALTNVAIQDDNVFVSQWTKTDFRTGERPWWV